MGIEDIHLNSKVEKSPEEEAVEFVEKNKEFFNHYAKGRVKFLPAPKGLNTFAFNLNTNEIYIHPRFFRDRGLDLAEEGTIFAVLHEIEHFLEKKDLLKELDGKEFFEEFLRKIKDRAYSFLDNRIADTRENSAIVNKTNRDYRDLEGRLYKEHLLREKDFTKKPRHLQFVEAISREFHIPDEEALVSPEVREKINEVKEIKSSSGRDILQIMADPETSMKDRIAIQDNYLWPIVEELRKKDIEDKKENNKDNDNNDDGEDSDGEENNSGQGEEGKEEGGKKGKTKKGKGKKGDKDKDFSNLDPNDIFKEDYDEANKSGMPNGVPIEKIKEAFDEWKKENGDAKGKELKEYADKLGVKKEDLDLYRNINNDLRSKINKETGKSIVEDLTDLVEKIISKRKKRKQKPRYPLEEGDFLIDPVEAVVQVSSGNLKPQVWEDVERKEVRGQMFGEVEITLVCDRSGSMEEPISKLIEQRKAVVFLLEALRTFNKRLDEEGGNIKKPLEIKSELYSFQADRDDTLPFKKMSKDISEKEAIEAMVKVSTAKGKDTTDYNTLSAINGGLTDKQKEKIKEGELKKIVIVFTDGDSGNKEEVKNQLKNLKENGVVVVCVGITQSGEKALTTYAPNARLAEKAEDLVSILADLLKEHLKDI